MKTLEELVETPTKSESTRRHSRKVIPTETTIPNPVRGSRRNRNWNETYHHDLIDTEKTPTLKLFSMGPIRDEIKPMLDNPNRSDDQALAIYHLLWDTKFFTDISGGNGDVINLYGMMHLCKKLKLVSFPTGSTIITQEESFGNKAYLILTGHISIMNTSKSCSNQPIFGEKTHKSRPSIFVNESPLGRSSARGQRFPSFAMPRRRVSAFSPFSPLSLFEGQMDKLKARKSFRKNLDLSSEDVSRDSNGNESSFVEGDEKTKIFDSGTRPSITEPVEKLVERLTEGDYFGAKCSFRRMHRSLMAVANTNVELLVLEKEDLEEAKNEFNNMRVEMLKFLAETFPNFYNSSEENEGFEEILHTADIKLLNYQRKVINEGEIGDEFYVIVEGECDLIKTVIYENSNLAMSDVKLLYGLNKNAKEEIKISSLQKGCLFGEEVLFNDKCPYEYSIRATSEKTKLLAFKRNEFTKRCQTSMLEYIKYIFTEKNTRNSKAVYDKLSKRGIFTDSEALKSPKPTVRIPKSRGGYDLGSYQSLSPTRAGNKLSNEDFDYVMPLNFQITSIVAIEPDASPKEATKDNYYIPISKSGQPPMTRTLKKPFHSFISHKAPYSCVNSPTQSKDPSVERKPVGNTSFQAVKDLTANMSINIEKVRGFKLAKAPLEISDIQEAKFDFGNKKKHKTLKPRDFHDGQSSPTFHRNVGLAGLITIKMKELEQVNDPHQRAPKFFKEQASVSERSGGLYRGTNIKHLKLTDSTSKIMFEDYKLGCLSPLEASTPKDSSRANKNSRKSKLKLNKIASHNPSPSRTPDLLPNIQGNKFSPFTSSSKARAEKINKLLC